jgi:hypothetical protein
VGGGIQYRSTETQVIVAKTDPTLPAQLEKRDAPKNGYLLRGTVGSIGSGWTGAIQGAILLRACAGRCNDPDDLD